MEVTMLMKWHDKDSDSKSNIDSDDEVTMILKKIVRVNLAGIIEVTILVTLAVAKIVKMTVTFKLWKWQW